LTKELFQHLNEKKDDKIVLEGKKLVAFSDSREDAANQAMGIEKEHFRLLVQELLITETERISREKKETNLYNLFCDWKNQFTAALDKDKLQNELNEKYPNSVADIEIIYDFIEKPNNIGKKSKYETRKLELEIVANSDEIPLKDLLYGKKEEHFGPIIKKILELGINPLGVGKEVETVEIDGEKHSWFDLFDLQSHCINTFLLDGKSTVRFNFQNLEDEANDNTTNTGAITVGHNVNGYVFNIINVIVNHLKLFIAKESLFKKFIYGIENAGIGYAVFKKENLDDFINQLDGNQFDRIKDAKNRQYIYNLFNTVLRICGNDYYYSDSEFGKRKYKDRS
jgi:hypothetical protein